MKMRKFASYVKMRWSWMLHRSAAVIYFILYFVALPTLPLSFCLSRFQLCVQECISRWARINNQCPVCKLRFAQIRGRGTAVHCADCDQAAPAVSEAEDARLAYQLQQGACEICGSVDNEEILLICDGCTRMYHTHCVSLSAVPTEEQWFCHHCVLLTQDDGLELEEDEEYDPRFSQIGLDDFIVDDNMPEEDEDGEEEEAGTPNDRASAAFRNTPPRQHAEANASVNFNLSSFVCEFEAETEEETPQPPRKRRRRNFSALEDSPQAPRATEAQPPPETPEAVTDLCSPEPARRNVYGRERRSDAQRRRPSRERTVSRFFLNVGLGEIRSEDTRAVETRPNENAETADCYNTNSSRVSLEPFDVFEQEERKSKTQVKDAKESDTRTNTSATPRRGHYFRDFARRLGVILP
ncbi:MAG: hypothetical protein MHM6MM_001740 [Cercozoa sp. M6MM]